MQNLLSVFFCQELFCSRKGAAAQGPDKFLRGVFLGDEVCCGATAAKCWAEGYGPLTRKIRQYLGPDAIIYANECLDITNPSLNVTEVPPDFDLISVDHCALTAPPPSSALL